MDSFGMRLQDLAELEHNKNLKEAHLLWLDGSIPKDQKYLPVCERIVKMRQLILARKTPISLTSKEICDFIMKLNHLTCLHIKYCDNLQCDHVKSLVDTVNSFVLPRRPNFKFEVSRCEQFELINLEEVNCE